jgi:hypothetical protein
MWLKMRQAKSLFSVYRRWAPSPSRFKSEIAVSNIFRALAKSFFSMRAHASKL